MAKNPGGRPTKYTDDMPKKMIDWFNRECITIDPDTQKPKLSKFPTFERYSLECGVTHQTLLNWCDAQPKFLEAYNACKGIQKDLLIEGGLSRAYDARFAQFLAMNVTDLKTGSNDDKNITVVVGTGGDADQS